MGEEITPRPVAYRREQVLARGQCCGKRLRSLDRALRRHAVDNGEHEIDPLRKSGFKLRLALAPSDVRRKKILVVAVHSEILENVEAGEHAGDSAGDDHG